MTKQEIIKTLEERGHVTLSEYTHNGNFATVYDYKGDYVGRCHRGTIERIARENDRIKHWFTYSGTEHYGDYMCTRYVEHENREHCHRIADDLDDYAAGRVKRCPECDEIVTIDDDCDVYRCPECGHVADVDEFDTLGMWDYFDDFYDIEYRIGGDRELRSVQVCVAWGGPSIYIDTGTTNVELHWWGDRASWPIDSDTVVSIDEWAEELYRC